MDLRENMEEYKLSDSFGNAFIKQDLPLIFKQSIRLHWCAIKRYHFELRANWEINLKKWKIN